MTRLEFHVAGDPVPQGSTRAFARNGRVITTNDPSGRLERWRGDIRQAAIATLAPSFEALDGAVGLRVIFRFRRPRSHYLHATKSRPEPVLRPDAPVWHTKKPDADRCLRSVLDALTNVVYRDDCQVARPVVEKVWSTDPGADIVVTELVS